MLLDTKVKVLFAFIQLKGGGMDHPIFSKPNIDVCLDTGHYSQGNYLRNSYLYCALANHTHQHKKVK